MSPERDCQDDVARLLVDEHTADRFLAGNMAVEDTPAALRRAAQLVSAAQRPASSAECEPPATLLVAMTTAAVPAPTGRARPGRVLAPRRLGVRAAAIGVVAVLGSTGAAAATGWLPDGAQQAVADLASRIGLDLPRPSSGAPPAPPAPHAGGRDAPAPARGTREAEDSGASLQAPCAPGWAGTTCDAPPAAVSPPAAGTPGNPTEPAPPGPIVPDVGEARPTAPLGPETRALPGWIPRLGDPERPTVPVPPATVPTTTAVPVPTTTAVPAPPMITSPTPPTGTGGLPLPPLPE